MWKYNYFQQPPDGSIGLVMRVHILWSKVDIAASEGNYEKWNTYLDCIWRNLSYKDELHIIQDEKGNFVDVTLSEKDKQLWFRLNKKIITARKKLSEAKTKEEYLKAKDEFFKALWLKDKGLRAYQHNVLGNYTKEVSKNPARSLWGG
ncbi:MAG: hypothetical protein QXO70_01880 [Candidatus Pacearchaeota archaeon]